MNITWKWLNTKQSLFLCLKCDKGTTFHHLLNSEMGEKIVNMPHQKLFFMPCEAVTSVSHLAPSHRHTDMSKSLLHQTKWQQDWGKIKWRKEKVTDGRREAWGRERLAVCLAAWWTQEKFTRVVWCWLRNKGRALCLCVRNYSTDVCNACFNVFREVLIYVL